MAAKKRIPILVLWVTITGCSLIGCSIVESFLRWPGEVIAMLEEKNISPFFSTIRSHRGDPDSHYSLACYYQERGRHKEAIREFEKLLWIDPHDAKAYNGMGISYDFLGDFRKAVESYEKALWIDPNLDYVQNNLGYSYLLQDNVDEAMIAFEKAVTLNRHEKRFHNNLGAAYAEKGYFQLALKAFKAAEGEATAHYNMAQFHLKKGRHEEAKHHYAIALTLDPSLAVLQTGVAPATTMATRLSSIPAKDPSNERTLSDPLPLRKTAGQGMPGSPAIQVMARAEETITPRRSDSKIMEKELPYSGELAIRPRPAVRDTPISHMEAKIERPNDSVPDIQSPPLGREHQALFKDVDVEISNGNGVSGMAKRVGHYLKEKGTRVVRLTNADHFGYPATIIYYSNGFEQSAHQIAHRLPYFQGLEELKAFDKPNIKIKVRIGRDLIRYGRLFEGNHNE